MYPNRTRSARRVFQAALLPFWLMLTMLLLGLVYVHWLVVQWGAQSLWVSNLLFQLPLIPAALLAWYVVASHQQGKRRAWAFVALAVTAYLVASFIWWYLQESVDVPPFPSLADALYLLYTPFLVLAFLFFPHGPYRPVEALRLGLDIAIIVAAAAVFSWYFLLAPTILAFPDQPLALAVALAYPVMDLVLLSLVLLMVLRQPRGEPLKQETLYLGGGMVLMGMADSFYFFGVVEGTFTNSSWYNAGFIGSNILVALAAYTSLSGRSAFEWRKPGWQWPRLYLPYAAVLASYTLMLFRASEGDGLASIGVQWGAAIVTLLVIARQIVTFAENDRLNRELQANSRRLEEAKDKAEAANRAKSTFLSVMSHELRTPLNAVLGYAQILLQDKALSERQVLGLSTIRSSGQHLLTLINDVLDLAKVEAGRLELVPGPVQLPDFLVAIGDMIRVRAEEKSLLYQQETSPDLPQAVTVDERRLRQVLLNLLGNAVKFTDRGQVTLRLLLRGQDEDEVRLRFEVEDSGVGLTPDQRERIFLPFEQVGDLTRRAGGTGLGLPISCQLVRQMGGDIQVESEPGRGSRFWFELRLPLADARPAQQAQHRVIGYEGAARRILVVDDVAANRALLQALLGELGFEVLMAENGEEGLRLAAESPPDLILMDRVMPVMDGLAATRKARALPALETVPIIMVSAATTQDDRTDAFAAGANAFVTKPIDLQEVLQSIGTLLDLVWRYDSVPDEPASESRAASATLIPPSRVTLEALHRLALAGNLRELHQRAGQLAAGDPRHRPFAERLMRLADDFRSRAVLKLIETHLGEKAQP
ncbi:response regulator [Halomonas campisalis]|uniref:histidine kinase n=1 Tax=Billgrantia campisalis TaxID=74661 RepID=A0ABS9P6L7_9GAMM|nr:ATP-binding protein [Halomonas campisalis]MCG6657417.1 response regulator [Halomonas campisalis]MDR5863238.1 ATP-binding protein [Halomonas campisalis]